jgi:hypothetical protein
LVVDDLLVVGADGVDMILDSLHKQTAQGGAVRLPCDCAFLLYSGHTSNPRVLVLALQLSNLIDELLKAFHDHLNLGLLQHTVGQLD